MFQDSAAARIASQIAGLANSQWPDVQIPMSNAAS